MQSLRAGHLTAYYAKSRLSRATLDIHHAILSRALKSAQRERLITHNVAADAEGRPKARERREDAKRHCWTADEARKFLEAADAAGPQLAALCALALDSGMRKGELLALPWSAVDLDAATVTVDRTLLDSGRAPVFGPTKTGAPRTIDISAETVKRLTAHKRSQAELKMSREPSRLADAIKIDVEFWTASSFVCRPDERLSNCILVLAARCLVDHHQRRCSVGQMLNVDLDDGVVESQFSANRFRRDAGGEVLPLARLCRMGVDRPPSVPVTANAREGEFFSSV